MIDHLAGAGTPSLAKRAIATCLGLVIAVGALPWSTARASDELSAHFISVQLENDSINNTSDQYYTSGIEVSLLHGDTRPPPWLSSIAEAFPFYENSADLNFANYSIGQKIFTPREKEAKELVPGDRPYAAYLYASAAITSRIDHDEYFDHGNMLELTVGLVGPSALGEETQNTMHTIQGYGRSNGWEHQLRDEPIIGLGYSRLWRMVRPAIAGLQYGLNGHLTMALGNAYTYAGGGAMLRFGDNLRRDLNPPNIRPGFPGVSYYQSLKGMDWYAFIGHEVRWVARDIFLDGNSFVESHSVEKEPVVGDTQLGLVFLHRDIRISISTTLRTREFKGQKEDTVYRAINFSFRH